MPNGALAGATGGAIVSIIIKAIDRYSKEFKKLDKSVKKQQTGFKKLIGVLKKTGIGYGILAGAAAGFAVSSVKSFLQAERATQAFNIVVGETANILLKDLKKASRGMVSDFHLMQAANRALMLGIDKNKLPELMKVAAARGKIMGRTVTEAFDDITIGIGRQSRMILDNLGIIVDAEEAYNKYAKQIGKTADSLTEMEKKQAYVNIVLEKSRGLTIAMAYAEETHQEKLSRLSAGWTNFKNKVGEAIVVMYDMTENIAKAVTMYDLYATDVKSPEVEASLRRQGNEIKKMLDDMAGLREEIEGYKSDLMGLLGRAIPEEVEARLRIAELEHDIAAGHEDEIGELDRLKQKYEEEWGTWRKVKELQIEYQMAIRSETKTTKEEIEKQIPLILKNWDESKKGIAANNDELEEMQKKVEKTADKTISEVERMIRAYKRLRGVIRLGLPSIGGLIKGSFQFGGRVTETGPYILHKGETVIPTTGAERSGGGITINIESIYGIDPQDISRALKEELAAKLSL